MLRIEGLDKTYRSEDAALSGVSLSVGSGEIIGLIGPSGAGKSTLIRCVNRLVEPSGGKVFLGDTEITALGRRDLRRVRRRIGMIFQEFALIERLTVMENVLSGRLGYVGFWASWFRRFPHNDIAQAFALLDRVGLTDQVDKRADALSGGQRQRVGIARALIQGPELLLVDEPTASLDPKTSRQVMRLLIEVCSERGLAAIVNIHDVGAGTDVPAADRRPAGRQGGLRRSAPIASRPTCSRPSTAKKTGPRPRPRTTTIMPGRTISPSRPSGGSPPAPHEHGDRCSHLSASLAPAAADRGFAAAVGADVRGARLPCRRHRHRRRQLGAGRGGARPRRTPAVGLPGAGFYLALGRHLDGMIESLTMTVTSTVAGIALSVPFALGAARNLAPTWLYLCCRAVIAFARAFQDVIIAIFFVAMFGFGPLAGFLTLSLSTIGFLGKLLADDIEEVDPSQMEAMRATGASWWQLVACGGHAASDAAARRPVALPASTSISGSRRWSASSAPAASEPRSTPRSTATNSTTPRQSCILIIVIVMACEYASSFIRGRIQ